MGKPTSKASEFYSVVLPTTSKAWFASSGVEAQCPGWTALQSGWRRVECSWGDSGGWGWRGGRWGCRGDWTREKPVAQSLQ